MVSVISVRKTAGLRLTKQLLITLKKAFVDQLMHQLPLEVQTVQISLFCKPERNLTGLSKDVCYVMIAVEFTVVYE